MRPYFIIIPSHDRDGLLERTLGSLAACDLPAGLQRVIIAENGAKLGAEVLVERFQGRLPLVYQFSEAANKSRALNRALADTTDELILFYDDDVRLAPGNPSAYLSAAAGRSGGGFFGGRCSVDYVEPPPAWLLPALPASAKGWSLGEEPCELAGPHALGFNWAAFAEDLKRVGGFNEHRGPGTAARGQESEMQDRLLAGGVKGYYVPQALVWHYVPKERCSPEWALARTLPTATSAGIQIASRGELSKRAGTWAVCWFKVLGLKAILGARAGKMNPETSFRYQQRLQWNRGVLQGLKLARESQLAKGATLS